MTSSALDYVKILLTFEPESLLYQIGERVWTLCMSPRDELLEYLGSVMATNPPNSRGFEAAYDIWLLMGERGVAA